MTSIVIPCHNALPYLGLAIESALRQTWRELEVIVVDDGSTDGSWAVARGFGERVRAERLEHGGAPRARNHGLALARGEHILFLDADDLLAPDTVEGLTRTLAAAPPRSVAAAPWRRLVRHRGGWRAVATGVPEAPGGDPLAGWLVRVYHPPCALLWPTELVRELGGWDETLTKNQDGDLAMRALVSGVGFVRAAGQPVLHRHYGPRSRSVASGRTERDVRSSMRVLEKVAADLAAAGRFERYRVWVARGYHDLARLYFSVQPELARECARRAAALAGVHAIWGPWPHRLLVALLGLERKERLAAVLARAGLGREERRLRL